MSRHGTGTLPSLVGAQLPGLGMDNAVQVRWEKKHSNSAGNHLILTEMFLQQSLLPQHWGEITEVHLLKSIHYSEVLPVSKMIF